MNGAPSDSLSMPARPCWYCRYFGRMGGAHSAVCERGDGLLRSQPENGCAFYEREPGVDDDGWRPIAIPARKG
jgi:hypothetical protein